MFFFVNFPWGRIKYQSFWSPTRPYNGWIGSGNVFHCVCSITETNTETDVLDMRHQAAADVADTSFISKKP